MSLFVRVDLAGQAVPVPKLEEATHVSVEVHMELAERYMALEAQNKRLYGKLMREIKAKKNYRERAERATLLGKKRTRSRPKREVVSRRDGYYAVHLVDLDAESEIEALAEALEYIREETVGGRLYRITDPGTGCWEAEVEVPISSEVVSLIRRGMPPSANDR